MAAVQAARRHGVLTRALRGVALQISPLLASEDELATIVGGIAAGVREAVGEGTRRQPTGRLAT